MLLYQDAYYAEQALLHEARQAGSGDAGAASRPDGPWFLCGWLAITGGLWMGLVGLIQLLR